jgi:YVTN family beta-propeller protein
MLARIALLTAVLVPAAAPQPPAFAIVEKIGGQVGFYTAEGKRASGVVLGAHPHEIVASPDRRFLYVSDNGILWMTDPGEGGNTISIIETASRRKVGQIELGKYRRPHGMDIDPKTNRMVVTTENPSGLLLLDLTVRKVIRAYDVKGKAPHMAVFGPDKTWAYASNTGSGTIAAVDLASGKVKLIPTDARPQGARLSRDGKRLYVTNSDGNSISIVDTARNERTGVIATGKGPGRVAITPDGRTLVYNLQAGEAVGFADLATGKQVKQIALGGRPLSLTLSADGRWAYLGIQDQDRIVVVSVPEQKIAREFPTPKGAGPDPVLPLE